MSSVLVFVFVLSVLVVIHEYGHFLMARWVGIRVERFSVGMGPVVFGKTFGETQFCVSLLPLGGYVKLAGESPEESTGSPWEFCSKSAFQKFLVVVAGPLMNALLAFFIFWAIFVVGQPVLTNKIGKVLEGGPAQKAGLSEGDRLVAINGKPVTLWEEILKEVRSGSRGMEMTVERDGVLRRVEIAPVLEGSKDLRGRPARVPFVGIAPAGEMRLVKNGFFRSCALALERVAGLTALIVYSLFLMITGVMPVKESLTGPIGIFFMTQEAAHMGMIYLFYFMGSLSVSLFVLNLLPIPVLDGGHLFFLAIEKLKGSPIRPKIKERITQGGVVALIVLMAFVILQDLSRFSVLKGVQTFFGGHP
ncbi:MAG: RIP metalloprotease RseP [Candidatus Omnitrophica bacterium]|nr:RIP metalloprotease RseP [Candidatus Omnitrophota bacterium]